MSSTENAAGHMSPELTCSAHAYLECPECGKLCRPLRENKDGGASYRCTAKVHEAEAGPVSWRIDGNGDFVE